MEKKELQVKLREMNEDDIEEVLAIDRRITGYDRSATYASVPRSFLGGQLNMSVVAEADERVVGFVFGQMVKLPYEQLDIALLQTMGVDPDYRHLRVGQRLMQEFMECCKKQGLDSVRVIISAHDKKMLSFLDSLKFARGEVVEFVKRLD